MWVTTHACSLVLEKLHSLPPGWAMSILLAAPTPAARSVYGIRIHEVVFFVFFGALHTSGGFRGTRVGAEELLLWRTGPNPRTTENRPFMLCFYSSLIAIIVLFSFSLILCHALRRGPICSLVVFNSCRAPLAQPNILFSLISFSSAAHLLRSQISLSCFAQDGRSKKIGNRRGPAEQVARQTP